MCEVQPDVMLHVQVRNVLPIVYQVLSFLALYLFLCNDV